MRRKKYYIPRLYQINNKFTKIKQNHNKQIHMKPFKNKDPYLLNFIKNKVIILLNQMKAQ